jgi:hypothetical protein
MTTGKKAPARAPAKPRPKRHEDTSTNRPAAAPAAATSSQRMLPTTVVAGSLSGKHIGSIENLGSCLPSHRLSEGLLLSRRERDAVSPSRRALLRELASVTTRPSQPSHRQHDPRRRQEPIQLSSLYLHSPHPGVPPTPYRPLSVVPQLPRSQGAVLEAGIARTGLPTAALASAQARASPVQWADGEKRRGRLEHENADAERQVAAVNGKGVFAVQMDVLTPAKREELLAAAKLRAEQRAAEAAALAAAEAEAAAARAAEAAAEEERRAAEARRRERLDAEARVRDEWERLAKENALVVETPFVAMVRFTAECDIELSFREGQELLILDLDSPEGWLMARDNGGNQGLVPQSYVKPTAEALMNGLPLRLRTRSEASPATGGTLW